RFTANRDKVVEMFDERFARMWEFYLLGAESWFLNGPLMVFQIQISNRRDAVPVTRDYIAQAEGVVTAGARKAATAARRAAKPATKPAAAGKVRGALPKSLASESLSKRASG